MLTGLYKTIGKQCLGSSMKPLALLIVLVGVALAGSSEHRSGEKERKKCNSCRDLKQYSDPTIPPEKTIIEYYKDNHGCKQALVTCPLNIYQPYLIVAAQNSTGPFLGGTGGGIYPQNTISCNKNKEWETYVIFLNKTMSKETFGAVVCTKYPPGLIW